MAASTVSGRYHQSALMADDEIDREDGDVRLSSFARSDSSDGVVASSSASTERSHNDENSESPSSGGSRSFLRELMRGQRPVKGEVILSRSGFVASEGAATDEGQYVSVEDLSTAFEYAAGEAAAADVLRANDDDDTDTDSDLLAPLSLEDRDRIHRIRFVSYSFQSVPTNSLHRAYPNLRHVDIRDNATLECVGSIVRQLPQLESLNVCDCPNLKSLMPLAEAAASGQRLALKYLWVNGCDLSSQTPMEWEAIFLALSTSSGPVERLALCRNNMSFMPSSITHLSNSLTDLFADNCPRMSLPGELGSMKRLRYLSLAGCDLRRLPPSLGRLPEECDLNLHRNPELVYPPPSRAKSMADIRRFFHEERMKLLRGMARFYPLVRRARMRANERLYRPGGQGYEAVKERFEEGQEAERQSRAEAMGGRTHRLSYLDKETSKDDAEDCEHGRKRTRRRSTDLLA